MTAWRILPVKPTPAILHGILKELQFDYTPSNIELMNAWIAAIAAAPAFTEADVTEEMVDESARAIFDWLAKLGAYNFLNESERNWYRQPARAAILAFVAAMQKP